MFVVILNGQLCSKYCLKIQALGWIHLGLTFIPVPKFHDFIILIGYYTKLHSSELKI